VNQVDVGSCFIPKLFRFFNFFYCN